jgi:cytochrome c553
VALGVPSIAGMESWYLDAQLKKFRAGTRGVHPDDAEGLRMRPMALSLPLDADTTAVAGYLTTLHAKPPVASVTGGDARRGMEIYSRCATCHGANGEGNQALSAPSLANKEPWYLLGQLKKFKAGQRGANPADVYGAMMRAQAMQLPDEQAMRDVLTHVQVLARP